MLREAESAEVFVAGAALVEELACKTSWAEATPIALKEVNICVGFETGGAE